MLRGVAHLLLPGVNYNTIIGLLGDHLCKLLLEGSADLTLEENKLLFDIVLIILMKVVVLFDITKSPHKKESFT